MRRTIDVANEVDNKGGAVAPGLGNILYIYMYYPKLPKSWKSEAFQQRLKLRMKDLKRVTVFDLSWNLDGWMDR